MSRHNFDQNQSHPQDRIKVQRVIEYEGPREWVERTLEKGIHGEYVIVGNEQQLTIREVSIGEFVPVLTPETLKVVENL